MLEEDVEEHAAPCPEVRGEHKVALGLLQLVVHDRARLPAQGAPIYLRDQWSRQGGAQFDRGMFRLAEDVAGK